MRILLTNDASRIAGGENFLLFLAGALVRRGHAVTIAPLAGSELAAEARAQGFATLEMPYRKDVGMLATVRLLAACARERRVDIVHTNSYVDRSIGGFAARLARAGSVASVHSCLSIRRNPTHAFRNRYCIDRFVPDGHSTKEILTGRDRIPVERVTVVHDALPEGLYQRSDVLRARIREEFAIPREAVLIGNVGLMVEFKGQRHLLDAIARLCGGDAGVRCMIVGDGPLMPALREQAQALGIADRVIFPGRRTDLSALYSAFDVFSLPSIDNGGETFPLVVLTALATALPVVASDVGDVRYMVRDGENGLLVPPGDTAAHAAALRALIADPALRARMGARGLQKSLEEHSLEAMTDAFEEIYRSVLDQRRR